MKKWVNVDIKVGKGSNIDEDVILGYPTARKIKPTGVTIGAQALMRSGTVIYDSTCVGNDFQTGHHVVIREENKIGDQVSIWANTVIDYGCQIGHRVKIHSNVYIAQFSVIEDDVFIAPGVSFANDKYPVSSELVGPKIKRGAKIGVNATVLPGVVIEEDALIGAGSVVTKDVPKGAVVAGNPARVMGAVSEMGKKS